MFKRIKTLFSYEYAVSSWKHFWINITLNFITNFAFTIGAAFFCALVLLFVL